MTPPWLPLPASLPERERVLEELAALLATESLVVVVAPPGAGKTTLMGAAARRSERPLLAVSLLGCIDADDALRALGDAAGALPAGDEAAILEALADKRELFVVVDDVANPAVLAPIERILDALPECRVVVGAEEDFGRPAVHLSAALDASGTPVALVRLASVLGVDSPEVALHSLPPDARVLAAFPMGLPAAAVGRLPTAVLRPDLRDRVSLRRGIASRLTPAEPRAAFEAGRRAVQPLVDLAHFAHLARPPDPRDVLLLRAVATYARDPLTIAELLAAEVRLLSVFGQPELGRRRLQEAPRNPGFAALGVLGAAEAELLLAMGEVEAGVAVAATAAEHLGAAGDAGGRAALWRRLAERLAERGEVERAGEAWRRARQAARELGDDAGVAAALRGAASLAISRGEWVGASALHEEADASNPSQLERSNLRLAEVVLALVRGESTRSRRVLDALEEGAGDDALLRANLWRCRAEALLRSGEPDAALVAADRAAGLYAGLGEGIARGTTLRLCGDIAAIAGQLSDARGRYRRALRQQMRGRDFRGIAQTLHHAALLEEHLGAADRARLLREQRAAALRIRGVG